jgi:hypothetical protein
MMPSTTRPAWLPVHGHALPLLAVAAIAIWLPFERNGQSLGGMVSPLGVLGFGDAVWNFEFWNNVRDASGMYYWGRKSGLPDLVDRARRIINLALLAPRNDAGFFCWQNSSAVASGFRPARSKGPSVASCATAERLHDRDRAWLFELKASGNQRAR